MRSWIAFRAQLLRTTALDAPATNRGAEQAQRLVVWRILATNNREVGRGAHLHTSAEDALRSAYAASARPESLQTIIVRGASPMTHGWVFTLEGVPVVFAARWYESAVEASSAAVNARKTLAGIGAAPDGIRGPDETRSRRTTPIA